MPSVIIESAGLLTTVQDQGRSGYQRFGMPVCGAMDTFSLQLANRLVGNPPGHACLEATITGPEILFTSSMTIAVSGADMVPCRNGKQVGMNCTIMFRSGDRLSFKDLKSGCRSYIAFAGGINVPIVMGSRSTYLRAKLGGYEGRSLRAGDELPVGEVMNMINTPEISREILPEYKSLQTIRITHGPEIRHFKTEALKYLYSSPYTVTDHSDRMGYRLSGPPLMHRSDKSDIISAGISFGTIQVPGNGQPVMLMADRQTTGGYPRIANIISVDLTLAAQLKPGDQVLFKKSSIEEALQLLRDRHRLFELRL